MFACNSMHNINLWTYLEMLTLECDLGVSVTVLIALAGVEVVKGPTCNQQEKF